MGGYLRHIELSKQLEKKAKEASRNRELAEERLGELQKLIDIAKKSDCSVGEAEELLGQASSALGAKDYRLSLEKSKDAEDKVKGAFLQRTQSILDSAESMLALLKRTDQDTSEYEALIGSARDSMEKGNFEEAVEDAKRGWIKGEKMLHEYLSNSFSSAQGLILAAKSMEKDIGMAEDLLKRARDALDASDYEEALTQTEEALELLGRELDFELDEEKQRVTRLVEAGEAFEADLSKAQDYLSRSETELQKGDFEKSFNLLKQAGTEAERQLKKALKSKEGSLETPIDEARKLGANTLKAEGLADEAMEAAKKDDYGTAAHMIRKALKELDEAKFQGVLQKISLSRPKFLRAREMGADVQGAVGIFNKARQALQEGNFKEALRHTEKGTAELDKLILDFGEAKENLEGLLQEVKLFSEEGVDLGEVENLLPAANDELSHGDLGAYSSIVKKIEKKLEGLRAKRTEELLEAAKALLDIAEDTGLSLVEEQEVFQDRHQALKAGETGTGLQETINLKARLEEKLTPHLDGRLNAIEENLPQAALGEVADTIAKARTALDVKDFNTAARMVLEAQTKAEEKARGLATTAIEGLAAAQQLSSEHGIESYGLREAHLAAKKAFDEANIPGVFGEVHSLEDHLANLAQESFGKVKDRVVEVRNSGIGIEDMKDLLRQAKDAITTGDVVQGLILLRDCDVAAKGSLDSFQKVHDIMASAAVLVAEGKKKDVNMNRAIELMLKGKTAFESGDLNRALEYAQDARSEAEKEISVLNVTDKIISAKDALELAQMLEVDVRLWSNLLQRAKQSLDSKDFREAVELAMEAEEQAKSGIRKKIDSQVARSESLLDEVQVPAREVGELEASISRAKSLLDDGRLRDAADTIRETLTGCGGLAASYKATLQKLKAADTLASELQAMNIRVSGPEKLLSKARKAFDEGNLTHAGQLAEEALTQLEEQQEESIKRTIASFESVVAQAKSDGLNTSEAEELLKKALELAEERKFQDALSAAMQSEAIVEKMGLQKEIAENALETSRNNIMGLPTPTPPLVKLIKEAEQAFEKGDYIASLEAAMKARDEFSAVRSDWEDLEASEETGLKFYKMAEKVGVDITKLTALLEEGRQATEKGDLESAKEAYDELATEAAGLTSSFVMQLYTEVKNAHLVCNLLDCEVEGMNERLSKGRAYSDEHRFEDAYNILSEAKQKVVTSLRRKIEELITVANDAIAHAEKIGLDTTQSSKMVEGSKAAMAEGHFEKAIRLAQESSDILKGKEDTQRRFMGSTFKAESLIKTAKKFGIDVKKAEKDLKKSFEMKESDPEGAIKLAQETLKAVEESLDAFSPSLELELNLEEAQVGNWVDAILSLKNSGKSGAKDLQIDVLGDLEVQELEAPTTITVNGEAEARVQVKFNSPGKTPIMVKVKARRVLDDQQYEWEDVYEFDVGEAPPKAEARAVVAEHDTKCSVCRGTIKKGFSAKECECGALLHEPCALRAGRCSACQRSL